LVHSFIIKEDINLNNSSPFNSCSWSKNKDDEVWTRKAEIKKMMMDIFLSLLPSEKWGGGGLAECRTQKLNLWKREKGDKILTHPFFNGATAIGLPTILPMTFYR